MSRRAYVVSVLAFVAVAAMLAFARHEPSAFAREGEAEGKGVEFISSKGCKKCHFRHARSWKKSVHAGSLAILEPGKRAEAKTKAGLDADVDYTRNPKCLKCHVTGYGQPRGYPEIKDVWTEDEKKLAGNNGAVGCESCHGAGSKYASFKSENIKYKRADVVALGLKTPVTTDVCTVCHNSERPTAPAVIPEHVFDFEKKKAQTGAVHDHTPLQHEH